MPLKSLLTNLKFTELLKSIAIIITIILGVITIINKCSPSKEKPKQPILKLTVEPVILNKNNAFVNFDTLGFKVETSGGAYKFSDNIRIDSFKVIDNNIFSKDALSKPDVKLTKILWDNLLLDYRIPSSTGLLHVKNDFIFDANELIALDRDSVVATFNLKLLYEFEGQYFIEKKVVPIILSIKNE